MALMFPRLARNFIKNGYFPTDEDTLSRILSALAPQSDRPVRVLDPCCGEGVALAEVHQHLLAQGAQVSSFGVEYNEERAWHAKRLLTRCIHADLNDCMVELRAFGLLWLNPPYGDLLSDFEHAYTGGKEKGGRKRLEKEFCRRAFPMLQAGGVLVLIVPYNVLDAELASLVSRHFGEVSVYAAPEQQFRQAVIFGVKRARASEPEKAVVQKLTQAQNNLYFDTDSGVWTEGFSMHCQLPEVWNRAPYVVPACHSHKGQEDVRFYSVRVDVRQLEQEIEQSPVLWSRFPLLFRTQTETRRQPLRKLSDWHLALMLAAGQVSGIVRSESGQVLLVKGDTFKTKSMRQETEINESTGDLSITRIATDRFVPMIRALDFTPESPNFGRVIHIQ
ncbi:Conserved hypothetical plasmid protein [gamma proteobacterium HdN1]|nr:Conserved hypothetical plasmid-related protein [gamma proteobacterium HdN1]CBL47121.1 Conserved hypothetical plasmid protein [gamma proteobacterium HdN1]